MTVLLMACSGVFTSKRQGVTLEKPPTIAVVPFFEFRASKKSQSLARCPLGGEYISVGEIAPEAQGVLTEIFCRDLKLKGYRIPDQEEIEGALAKLDGSELSPEILAQRIGETFAVDLVLMGWIFRFQERIGTAWGASRPAALAFIVHLFGVEEGTVLWQGRYDTSQDTPSENPSQLFRSVKRAGKWETAKQIASGAVAELLLSFPSVAVAE